MCIWWRKYARTNHSLSRRMRNTCLYTCKKESFGLLWSKFCDFNELGSIDWFSQEERNEFRTCDVFNFWWSWSNVRHRFCKWIRLVERNEYWKWEFFKELQVRSIADHVRPDRQCLLFSATFKKKVEKLG